MELQTIVSALMDVVQTIQRAVGDDKSDVSGSTCPVTDIPSFDSIICVQAIYMLTETLSVEIADNVNIFVSGDGKQFLTIDQASAVVYEGLTKGET
jgi:acyl carrier protein